MIVEENPLATRNLRQPGKAAQDAMEGVNEGVWLVLPKQLPKLTRASQPHVALVVESLDRYLRAGDVLPELVGYRSVEAKNRVPSRGIERVYKVAKKLLDSADLLWR